jgi:hypothetical protein
VEIFYLGATLQAGRSRVRFPMRPLNYVNLPNLSNPIMTLESTQHLTLINTRNLSGVKDRPVLRADNLTVICSRLFRKCGILDVSQPNAPLRSVTGIVLPFLTGDS